MKKLRSFPGVVLFGTIARIFALVSQFAILLTMTRLLPKSDFGDAMIVFTLYRLFGLGLGTGLGTLLLYHVGRNDGDRELDIRLTRTLTLLGLAVSTTLTLAVIVAAPTIAAWFQKPSLVPWLQHMSPMIVFGTLNFVVAGSFDGRSQITRSIVVTEIVPNALRLLGFLLILLLSLPDIAIAYVLWISLALPWLLDARRLINGTIAGLGRLSGWDLRYAGWFTLYPMATQQLQGIDMLVVGWLFSSTLAADYSIASRLAVYYPFLQYVVVRSFAPRVGTLHSRADIVELNTELASIKRQSIIAVYVMTGILLLGAPLMLHLLGDYENTMPILVLLALPVVVRSVFAGADAVLKMTGYAGASASIAMLSAATIVIGSYLAAPILGIYALPAAMLASAVLFSPVMAWIASWSGIRILGARDLFWTVVPLVALICALSLDHTWLAALLGGATLLAMAALRAALPVHEQKNT